MNLLLLLLFLFSVAGEGCFFQNCNFGYNWKKRAPPNDNFRKSSLYIRKEYPKCYDWTETSFEVCKKIHVTCCVISTNNHVVCDQQLSGRSFSEFICGSAKQKLGELLQSDMSRNEDGLEEGDQCCIDTTPCCFDDVCTPRITCSRMGKKTEIFSESL